MDRVLGLYKLAMSFVRTDWSVDDYPVRYVRQPPDGATGPRWTARIIGWPGPTGMGATKAEARAHLDEVLTGIGRSDGLRRPGVPMAFRIADDTRIQAQRTIVDRMVRDVFDLEWAFVSDSSSLSDFVVGDGVEDEDADVERYRARIRAVFGVDVSGVESGNIAEIAETIAHHGALPDA